MFDFDFWEYVVGLVVLGLIVFICWAGYTEQKAWEAFKVEHHCVLTGRRQGQSVVAVTGNGSVGVGSTSPQATYHCDDGVDYTRDEL